MNTKFCFLASLALVGSVSITVLSPKHADASRAKVAGKVVESIVKTGRVGSLLGVVQQNWIWVGGCLAGVTIGGIGMEIMKSK